MMYQISVFTLYYMQTKTEKNVMSGLLNCCFMTGFKSIKLYNEFLNLFYDFPLQWLTIAIVFELIYYTNGYFDLGYD